MSGARATNVVEQAIALPALTTAVLDSASIVPAARNKTLYLVVTTLVTWVTAGQATWQPYATRAAFVAAGGAASQLTAAQVKLGAAVNLGGAGATTLPVGLYRLSSVATPDLAVCDAQLGAELIFPSALTAGAASLFLEASG